MNPASGRVYRRKPVGRQGRFVRGDNCRAGSELPVCPVVAQPVPSELCAAKPQAVHFPFQVVRVRFAGNAKFIRRQQHRRVVETQQRRTVGNGVVHTSACFPDGEKEQDREGKAHR